MSTFKTCVRIMAAHRLYILIYLVLLSTFGLFTGMARSDDYSSQVTTATANVAVRTFQRGRTAKVCRAPTGETAMIPFTATMATVVPMPQAKASSAK